MKKKQNIFVVVELQKLGKNLINDTIKKNLLSECVLERLIFLDNKLGLYDVRSFNFKNLKLLKNYFNNSENFISFNIIINLNFFILQENVLIIQVNSFVYSKGILYILASTLNCVNKKVSLKKKHIYFTFSSEKVLIRFV